MCAWDEGRWRTGGGALAMFSRFASVILLLMMAWVAVPAHAGGKRGGEGIGTPMTPAEIAAIDRDVRPDGRGLPEGSGMAMTGESTYLEKCAACHGEFGEGLGRIPALMGGEGTLATDTPRRTIGSFWPHAAGVFDYIRRAMPEGHAFSLPPAQVYALTAYLLQINGIVEEDFVASAQTLPKVRMPNRDGFVMPPHPRAQGRRCMSDCRKPPRVIAVAPRRTTGVMEAEEELP